MRTIQQQTNLVLQVILLPKCYELCQFFYRVPAFNDFLIELVVFEVGLLLEFRVVARRAEVLNEEIFFAFVEVDHSEAEIEVNLVGISIDRQVALQVLLIVYHKGDLWKLCFA